MTNNTQEEIAFKEVQYIHLDFLRDIDNYILSSEDELKLFNLAKDNNPISGYARSLYHKLTGEKVLLDHNYNSRTRNNKSDKRKANEEIVIFPNPTSDRFTTIELDPKSKNIDYSVSLYDMNGSLINTKSLKLGSNQIDLEDKLGLFLIAIYKNGEVIKTEKLLRLN